MQAIESAQKRSTVAGGVAVLVAVLTTPAGGQELHADLCLHGCPSGAPTTNDIVDRDIYVLSSNDSTKFADWVAYRVTASTIGPTADRVWRPDPWLAADETLEPNDYRGAFAALNTDRGHQAPLASLTVELVMAQQFGRILYVEGTTDLEILRAWAAVLEHPLCRFLEAPFWKPMAQNPWPVPSVA